MAEVVIEDFSDEINNCPVCTALLRGDVTGGVSILICSADRKHGYFKVRRGDTETWSIEYVPWAP